MPPACLDAAPRHRGVLLVLDVVESVRLMEEDEGGFVRRWRQLVAHTEHQVLPGHAGRIVKSLGDGLMLEFREAMPCVAAGFAIQGAARALSRELDRTHQLRLRMGAHVADYVRDRLDIYGAGVNLTARIAGLAGADQFLVSSALREQLAGPLHAQVEDLGECRLRHVPRTTRLFRLRPPGCITSAPEASS